MFGNHGSDKGLDYKACGRTKHTIEQFFLKFILRERERERERQCSVGEGQREREKERERMILPVQSLIRSSNPRTVRS